MQRAQIDPTRLSPNEIISLQRSIGNQAVLQLLRHPSPPAPSPKAPLGPSGGKLDSQLENRLLETKSGGHSLPADVRRQIEPQLGADLNQVKIHTGPEAVQLSRALGAKAFTHRNHIYYGEGQSPQDLRLTTHEAVHTIQQGSVQRTAHSGAAHEITKAPSMVSKSIQRDGSNWDQFKDFNNSWGLGGWGEDQEWWMNEMNPKNNKGLGKVGTPLAAAPFALGQMGLSTVGRGLGTLGAGAYYGGKGLGSMAKSGLMGLGSRARSGWGKAKAGWGSAKESAGNTKRNKWDSRSTDQKGTLLGQTVPSALSGISATTGGGSTMIDHLAGTNQQSISSQMQAADPTMRNLQGGRLDSVSETGLGFGAATGILGGISGLIDTGRGVGNIFGRKREGKGYQRATRGFGRMGVGMTRAFSGAAYAGKSIANLAGSASSGATFLASAAVPAQAALSGIDFIKGTYGLAKSTKRKGDLRGIQKNLKDTNPEMSEFAQLAKQYQSKRQKKAAANMAAGVLGGVGAGLILGGVTAPVGLALLATSGALKGGAALWGKVRDRTWGKKDAGSKRAKEMEWATLAAKNYKDKDIRAILEAMGAEDMALDVDQLDEMTEDQRVNIMMNQLMKR